MKPKIYFIPGTGTNGSVFKYLNLPEVECIYLDFIEPLKNETMQSYSKRMANQIPENETPLILGLSLGGLIAQEIAAIRPVTKIILLSSLKSGQKLQAFLRLINFINIIQILPPTMVKKMVIFGIKTLGLSKSWSEQFLSMNRSFSGNYYKFVEREILKWNGPKPSCEIVQIHGTKDKVLPFQPPMPKYVIHGGGHFMVATHAKKISEAILQEIGE